MKSKSSLTKAEAAEIVELIKEKLKADPAKQKGIRNKIRKIGFYASDYGFRDGYTVEQFLRVVKIIGGKPPALQMELAKAEASNRSSTKPTNKLRIKSDESYVIDLCDEVLGLKALRQHRFDFLKGDSGTILPVDAYYPTLNLVIEFRERQHTEEVKFFDRRQTVSGVGRGEQRKIYDQRRRDLLPKHGLRLVEIGYEDFEHTKAKRLVRNRIEDHSIIKRKMRPFA